MVMITTNSAALRKPGLEKNLGLKKFLGFKGFLGFCTKTEHESTTQNQMVYLSTVSY